MSDVNAEQLRERFKEGTADGKRRQEADQKINKSENTESKIRGQKDPLVIKKYFKYHQKQ